MAIKVNLFNQKQQTKYLSRTGISVNIQNIGKFTECIAVRVPNSLQEIKPGIWLKKECREFSKGNFTNIYNLFWNSKQSDIVPEIHSSNTPYSLADKIKKDINTVGVINGAFFFLADIAHRKPLHLPYDLCVREGKVFGLPSWDAPIAYILNGKLQARETQATGAILIGKKRIRWVGVNSKAKSKLSHNATLYNSKCSSVVRLRDPLTNIQIGVLDDKVITTPANSDVIDIVVDSDKKDNLIVTKINEGGGTHFFEGLFILQIEKNRKKFKVGEKVVSQTLDRLSLKSISAGITIGKNINDASFLTVPQTKIRDARSILAEDNDGYMHFVVFDGSKYIPGFQGVTIKEILSFFPRDRFKWAYLLDGGGSSRLVARENKKVQHLANEFAFKKLKSGQILWDWKNARYLTSSISIRI
jgi:hypothetical protein